jgi:hypothetical protein
MSTESEVKSAICTEYEALLKRSCASLTNWKNGRLEIRRLARKGRKIDNELRVLQARFAKAYADLQYHTRTCEICQAASLIHSGLATNSASADYQLHN